MERREIVSVFLKAGVLLKTAELEWLICQTDSVVASILSAVSPGEELAKQVNKRHSFEIIKNLTAKPSGVTPELQSAFFNSRYQQMKTIIEQRINREWTSINRLPWKGDIFVAGVVRNITNGEKTVAELEDPTGVVSVSFAGRQTFDLDDFVAVRASVVNRSVIGKEVLYPDIPIRQATYGQGRGCFISDLHLEEAPQSDAKRLMAVIAKENVDFIFVAGDVGNIKAFEDLSANVSDIPVFLIPGEADTQEQYPQLPLVTSRSNIISLSNPCAVRVGGLCVVMCHAFDASMLRKRHLGASGAVLNDDFLVLDCLPDIVCYGHDHKPFISNYKATTLVNAGSLLTQAKPVVVDFGTRDFKQIGI